MTEKEYAWTGLVCSFCSDLLIVYYTVISICWANLVDWVILVLLTESILKNLYFFKVLFLSNASGERNGNKFSNVFEVLFKTRAAVFYRV